MYSIQNLENTTAAPLVDPEVINTERYFEQVRLRALWPPGNAVNRETVALLPRSAVPDDTEWLDELAPDDWFVDGGGPCLVLGEAVMASDGKYYPRTTYTIIDALHKTKLFRAPQRAQEVAARAANDRRLGKEQAATERAAHWLSAVEAERKEAERKAELARANSPLNQSRRIAALEARVEELGRIIDMLKAGPLPKPAYQPVPEQTTGSNPE